MTEEWRDIPGYEGRYQVSDAGRVRSALRGGRIRKLHLTPKGGYWAVHLVSADGKHSTRRVHNLATEAFLGPPPEGLEVRHLDGNPQNATLGNLAYGTRSANNLDRKRHGTHPAVATHCRRGHPFSDENTCYQQNQRFCRTCRKASSSAGYQRRRAA